MNLRKEISIIKFLIKQIILENSYMEVTLVPLFQVTHVTSIVTFFI